MKATDKAKIGIVGTGFIGDGLKKTIAFLPDLSVSRILTQRGLDSFPGEQVYTNSVDELIEESDLVVECNGDAIYATEVLSQVLDAGIPVVTMDAELHITSGSYLSTKGLITEAEGDQPGALAALGKGLASIGFVPLVYGNLKGFLNYNPTVEDMQYWAKFQGISLEQVTESTDGTKVQVEQALIANGMGAVIGKQGMHGLESEDIYKDSKVLASYAKQKGMPISDYLLRKPQAKGWFPAGVFITAEYDQGQASVLKYLKLGEGPFYTLVKNYHLCHLEIPNTIRQVLQGEGVLLDNSMQPSASVCVIAKQDLKPGLQIKRANRSFLVRGEALCIKDAMNHLPLGLTCDLVVRRPIKAGQMIELDDVDLPDSRAYQGWLFTRSLVK